MSRDLEPLWLEVDDVVVINQTIVQSSGENHFLRDVGALDSALRRGPNAYHYDGQRNPMLIAALIVHGIGKAHAFEQGNKRTAWSAARIFLMMNGIELNIPEDQQLAVAIGVEALIAGNSTIYGFADQIAELGKSIPI